MQFLIKNEGKFKDIKLARGVILKSILSSDGFHNPHREDIILENIILYKSFMRNCTKLVREALENERARIQKEADYGRDC